MTELTLSDLWREVKGQNEWRDRYLIFDGIVLRVKGAVTHDRACHRCSHGNFCPLGVLYSRNPRARFIP